MKREIKFRAWDGHKMLFQNEIIATFPVEGGEGSLDDLFEQNKDLRLMQFTGLKDKNGKEIYEGDIVKVYGEFEIPFDDKKDYEKIHYEHVGIISFENGSFIFKNHLTRDQLIEHRKYFPESDTDITSTLDGFLGIEVIGNIYEHPELLTQTK